MSQAVLLLTLVCFAIIRFLLFHKIDKIEIISDLDYKILWKYEKLLLTLKRIINIEIVVQIIVVFVPRILFIVTGKCHWNTRSEALNQFLWVLCDPIPNMVQISMYMFIFWRKRLGRDARVFMHQVEENHYGNQSSFATPQKNLTNSLQNSNIKSSGLLNTKSTAVKTSAIILGGSEGDISIDF